MHRAPRFWVHFVLSVPSLWHGPRSTSIVLAVIVLALVLVPVKLLALGELGGGTGHGRTPAIVRSVIV